MKPSIRATVSLAIAGCLLIGASVQLVVQETAYLKMKDQLAERAISRAAGVLANQEADDTRTLVATLDALLADVPIISAFARRDREELYRLTAPVFSRLKQRHGITHWYFINPKPDATCFLRVHDKALNGDVVDRATFNAAAANGDLGAGKELGKTAFALRVVRPILLDGKLIGYMELGEEIDHFLAAAKRQTQDNYALVLEKKFLDEKAWRQMRAQAGSRDDWDDHPHGVVVASTSPETAARIPHQGEPGRADHNAEVVEGLLPVKDAAGREVGSIFVQDDISSLHQQVDGVRTTFMVTNVVVAVAMCLLIVLLLTRLVFRRLEVLMEKATRVVGGDFETAIIPSAQDEVGQFEALLEQFRVVFVDTLKQLERKNRD